MLDGYYQDSLNIVRNEAHRYFPHVTLTFWAGFAPEELATVVKALANAVTEEEQSRPPFLPVAAVVGESDYPASTLGCTIAKSLAVRGYSSRAYFLDFLNLCCECRP